MKIITLLSISMLSFAPAFIWCGSQAERYESNTEFTIVLDRPSVEETWRYKGLETAKPAGKDIVKLVREEVGVRGEKIFTFKTLRPGSQKIVFKLVRSRKIGPESTVGTKIHDIIVTQALTAGQKKLLDAVGNNDITKIRTLLKEGIDPNFIDRDGNTLLHHAIMHMHGPEDLDTLRELLKAPGIKIDIKNAWGETPLDMANNINRTEMIKLLEDFKK